jgi:hypothetical protein
MADYCRILPTLEQHVWDIFSGSSDTNHDSLLEYYNKLSIINWTTTFEISFSDSSDTNHVRQHNIWSIYSNQTSFYSLGITTWSMCLMSYFPIEVLVHANTTMCTKDSRTQLAVNASWFLCIKSLVPLTLISRSWERGGWHSKLTNFI